MVQDASLIALACRAYCGWNCDVVLMCVSGCSIVTQSQSLFHAGAVWVAALDVTMCMVETRPHWCIAHMQVFLERGMCLCCFVACGIRVFGSQYH